MPHHSLEDTPATPIFLRSGQVAAAAGVNTQTLRYYERRGLLVEPQRTAIGHRQYPAHTVTLLNMIKRAQQLGFSLNEIHDILSGRSELATLATRKLAELDSRIDQLIRDRKALTAYCPLTVAPRFLGTASPGATQAGQDHA